MKTQRIKSRLEIEVFNLDYSETISVASGCDAFTLKRLVDIGALPNTGAIKEKVEASPELQLTQAIENTELTPSEKLKLAGYLTLMVGCKNESTSS